MMTTYDTLRVETPRPRVLLVTLNRPEVSNALNTRTGVELHAVFAACAQDPSAYGAMVLTGAGERVFCAGADLKERRTMAEEAWQDQHRIFERMIHAIIDCPVPVVAAVNGDAYAGGCELVLCSDFAYAVPSARFALTEITIGIMPGGGGTQTLPRAVGERRAKEIILTGRPFSADEALRWGVVNRLCAPGDLAPDALAAAEQMAASAPDVVRKTKAALQELR
jgi:enoyl-CoA hydratase/carnithine racemase